MQRKACRVKLLEWFPEKAPPASFPWEAWGCWGGSDPLPYARLCCPASLHLPDSTEVALIVSDWPCIFETHSDDSKSHTKAPDQPSSKC